MSDMRNKSIFLTLAFLALSLTLSAQTNLGGLVGVSRPDALNHDILKKTDAEQIAKPPRYGQSGGKVTSYWTVFSDRADNVTYTDPKGKTPFGKLEFGEKLRVAEIKDGYAHVFYDPKNDPPKISHLAKSKGWVPMENLLLWDKGLYDNIGISLKAVICVNMKKDGKIIDDNRKLYFTPTGSEGEKLPTDMKFYYILKQSGSRVLLGLNAVINTAADIYGWVEESSFVAWNSRTCLEPTWNPDDVEYFNSKYYTWRVYADADKQMKEAPIVKTAFPTQPRNAKENTQYFKEEYKYRVMPVRHLRYPILEGTTENAYHCTTFGSLGKGKNPASGDIDAMVKKAYLYLDQRKIVNIAIVIDGTSSMKPYFKSVQAAIDEFDKFFAADDKVNVGVLIYRDIEDNEGLVECFPSAGGFTKTNNQKLRQWLANGGKYGVRSKAKGNRECVFNGIDKALDQFFPATKDMKMQSNIMLVIGDCGDNLRIKIERAQLIDKLAAQNVALMGFQVNNKEGSEDYECFNEQLTTLMKGSVQKRYDTIRSSDSPKQKIVPEILPGNEGYNMINSEGYDLFIGMHRCCPHKNKPMPAEVLTGTIEEILARWKESVDYLSVKAGSVADHGTEEQDDVEADPLERDALIAAFGGDKKLYEALAKQNALISFKGYAPRQKDMRDIYKVVVFFPAGELRNLLVNLTAVQDAAQNETADRRPYYEAMMSLAKTVVSQEELKSTSYYAILAKVFGLVDYKPKRGFTLDDIVEPTVVSNKMYRRIVNDMSSKIDRLKTVTSVDYPFLLEYKSTNDKYYWLPSDYLPLDW